MRHKRVLHLCLRRTITLKKHLQLYHELKAPKVKRARKSFYPCMLSESLFLPLFYGCKNSVHGTCSGLDYIFITLKEAKMFLQAC